VRRTFYGQTREAVFKKLTKAHKDHHSGLRVSAVKETVGEFLKRWLEQTAKQNVRPKTYRSYAQLIQLHLAPELGRFRLDQLSPAHVQHFVNAKLQAGLSPRTVQYLRAVLRKALNQALRWDLVQRNVATLIDMPAGSARRRSAGNPFTRDELPTLIAALKKHRDGALFRLALMTGLRQGEILGLHWEDVDLAQKRLTVRVTLQWINKQWQFAEPKTPHSRRTIVLTDALVKDLKAHRKRQLQDRLLAGGDWVENGLVFTTNRGTPLDGVNVTRAFRRLQKRADISPVRRFHDLRDTAATLLMAGNVHPRIVAELLGHTDTRTTLDLYSHVSTAMQAQASQQLHEIIERARAGGAKK